MPDAMDTVWQQQQDARRAALRKQWADCGFPDSLSEDVQNFVAHQRTLVMQQWLADTALEDLCDDHLMHWWLACLDHLCESSDAS